MREKVDARQRKAQKEDVSHFTLNAEAQIPSRTRNTVQNEVIQPMTSGSPDSSDKENSTNNVSSLKSRKIAKLSPTGRSGLKRKKVEDGPEIPEKYSKVDKIVLTDSQIKVDGVTQTEQEVPATLTTRRRILSKLNPKPSQDQDKKLKPESKDTEAKVESSKPWRMNMKPPSSIEKPEHEKPPEP